MVKAKRFEYNTVLVAIDRGIPGTFAGFPYKVREEFATGGPVRINCWIDGVHKTGSLVPVGNGEHVIHFRKEVLKKIGKAEGDTVHLVVEQNLSPRVVNIPDDFQWLLHDDPELNKQFQKLSVSYKEAIINYINEAKRPETRAKRIEMFIGRIKTGFSPGQKQG